MSVSEVTARISQIQSQLALVAPAPTRASGSSAAAFATALSDSVAGRATASGVSGEDVVAEARKYLGVPYVWGGTDPSGLDCSGLVQLVYKNLGYDLPRVSYQQAGAGQPVASMADAKPGDLLAWDNSSRNDGVDHIAIYVGNGQMIEAPRPGGQVQLVPVTDTPDVIRRILPETTTVGRVATGGVDGVPAGTPYAQLFERTGAKYGVSPELLAAIARQESGFDPAAVSSAGAQGLMQLMPATADGLGVENSFDPVQAVDGAARLMRSLLDRFQSTPLALAAYNAGPGAVLRYDGIPPYPETQNYVRSIMAMVEDR